MKGNSRDVIIAGVLSDAGDPPIYTINRLTVNGSGFLGANLYLQDSQIFSLNPFSPQFDVDVGNLDMLPVVNFQYMAGPDTGTGATTIFGRVKYCSNVSIFDPTASMMVAELAGELVHDAPAANTQAQVTILAAADEMVRIGGFGISVTAVAAIAAAIQATLVSDHAGSPTTVWSQRIVVPAGQTKEIWIEGPFALFQSAQLTVAAPGATNFVTATISQSSTGNPPS